jgi:UDP-N-acetylmuramate: L-alanyl-gamma-D-glutamyl-meso-diaminopimelate ligase
LQEPFHEAEHLYLLPIGGTAMASLAGLLQADGHRVEGVDTVLYPPMSTQLEALGIPVRVGWNADAIPDADRTIVGNAVPRSNPEVQALISTRRPFLSQPEAVCHYLLARGRRGFVVAGTHGKTTTTSLASWVFERCGADPTCLVGGLLKWSRRSFRLGRGPWMVVEGDEYNSAFFDRGPKFLHYRPHIFVLGPVEFDHADLYPTLDAVLTAFRAGTAQVPRDGAVVVNADSDGALACVRDATAPVVRVGSGDACDLRLGATRADGAVTETAISWQGAHATLRVPMAGRFNALNAAQAVAGTLAAGLDLDPVLHAVASFPGVARRMDLLGEVRGISVVDDFAHHPTAVAVTLDAARGRWPGRRLVVAFEPRSITAARADFHASYRTALARADLALVTAPYHSGRLDPADQLDRGRLASELQSDGVATLMPDAGSDPVAALVPHLRSGDVVLGCSSGDFGAFHRRLLDALGDPS